MTQQTITGLFDKRSDATHAIDQLVKAGIPRTSIKLMPENETSSTTTTRSSYDTKRDEKGFWKSLGNFFFPDEDRYTYAEAMNRGSIMVTVTVDEAHAARAEDILEEHGTVNIDEREASWRKEGWPGYAGTASPGSARKSTEEVIPVVEEQLKVGKRQVIKGRVRVRSYVVETPVNEQVSLRSESVHVERRPVDRATTAGEDAFRERTIDAQATSEEAVVSKSARVTGEVSLEKHVEDRTETVKDKVRRTVAIAGLAFGHDAAQNAITAQLSTPQPDLGAASVPLANSSPWRPFVRRLNTPRNRTSSAQCRRRPSP